MRGFGFIIGYILGNEKARDWCIKKICQASLVVDKFLQKESKDDKLQEDN